MPNKAYWNQVKQIMEFTDAMGSLAGEEMYGAKDKSEVKELIADAERRAAGATDQPMELITLPGLAREFKEVAAEIRASYRNAKTEEERQAILDEVLDCTGDFFTFLAEEASEVFGEASKRLGQAAKENAWDEDDDW